MQLYQALSLYPTSGGLTWGCGMVNGVVQTALSCGWNWIHFYCQWIPEAKVASPLASSMFLPDPAIVMDLLLPPMYTHIGGKMAPLLMGIMLEGELLA